MEYVARDMNRNRVSHTYVVLCVWWLGCAALWSGLCVVADDIGMTVANIMFRALRVCDCATLSCFGTFFWTDGRSFDGLRVGMDQSRT